RLALASASSFDVASATCLREAHAASVHQTFFITPLSSIQPRQVAAGSASAGRPDALTSCTSHWPVEAMVRASPGPLTFVVVFWEAHPARSTDPPPPPAASPGSSALACAS